MILSKEDLMIISNLLSTKLETYDKRFLKMEKKLLKLSKKKQTDNMTYDEMAKNIVALSGDEYYRDFNIVRIDYD